MDPDTALGFKSSIAHQAVFCYRMSEDLKNEVDAINSIYGENTMESTETAGILVLSIPQYESALRLAFPPQYPGTIPQILGVERAGDYAKKGYGTHVLELAREMLQRVFIPGSVCLFELLQGLETALSAESTDQVSPPLSDHEEEYVAPVAESQAISHYDLDEEPQWSLSVPATEKKSTFLARACAVSSPAQARACVAHLLDTNKRVAKATHNITAYRIRSPPGPGSTSEIICQDCDEDGESAAGGRLLHLLQVMDVWGVLVVVSRWYGGVKLGPDRFSIINNVAREAVVEGGWTRSRVMKD
jgi:hypothetical protein